MNRRDAEYPDEPSAVALYKPFRYIRTNQDYELAAALWLLKLINTSDLPTMMADALEDGLGSDSVVELAGVVRADTRDDVKLVVRAFEELGQTAQMSENEACEVYTDYVAHFLARLTDEQLEGFIPFFSGLPWQYFEGALSLLEYIAHAYLEAEDLALSESEVRQYRRDRVEEVRETIDEAVSKAKPHTQ